MTGRETEAPDDPPEEHGPASPPKDAAREPAEGPEVARPHRLRFTRRRLLMVDGAALVSVAATIAGVEGIGASGGMVPGGDCPVLGVEPPPEAAADEWVLQIDSLVETSLTINRTGWE